MPRKFSPSLTHAGCTGDQTPRQSRGVACRGDLRLEPLGYELVDWDHSARSGLVRVFIDKPGGVDVEDCAQVSTHLTHLFAAEQIDYDRLEVSSPGLDRPLKKAADFARFSGEEVRLTFKAPWGPI